MKLRHLKPLRVVVSLLILLFLLVMFIGITNPVTNAVSTFFLRLQFFPSVMRFFAMFFTVATLGFVFVLMLTLLFGRVYCSSICPLGTVQDIFIRGTRRLRSRKKRRFGYTRSRKMVLRYSILGATLVLWFFGSLLLVNLLDPFSNFGKLSATFVQPLYLWVNNQVSFILQGWGNYSLPPLQAKVLPLHMILVSGSILITLLLMTFLKGRLFCNSLCPVGSILGLISQKARYRISFNEHSCNHCGKCERVCKAECLDSKSMHIDHNRCVSCFNCLASCPNEGLHYKTFALVAGPKSQPASGLHKRQFLLTLAAAAASIPLFRKNTLAQGASAPGLVPTGSQLPVLPPGAQSYDHYTGKCIACYLCVSACPKNVIVPSFLEFGLQGFMQPRLDYHKSFCNFDCVRCTEVCPTGAITPQTVGQKQTIQVGVARFMVESCIVMIDRTDCGACSEHCPTKAVSMVPWEGLFLPQVEPELCIGCGACEYACPTQPYKAIYVEANAIHQQAVPITDDQGPQQVEQDDFPF